MFRTKRSSRPRFVISSSYGTPNVGDEALLESLITALRDAYPESRIGILSRFPAFTRARHPDCETVVSGVCRGIVATVVAISRADMLVIGPGGIIQDSSSFGNLIFHLSRVVFARLWGVRIVGCGLGVGPLKRRSSRMLVAWVLRGAARIAVRDSSSYDWLLSLGIPHERLRVAADMAFLGPAKRSVNPLIQTLAERKEKTGCYLLGVSLRPEVGRHHGEVSGDNYRAFLDGIIERLKQAVATENCHVVFCSMHPEQDDPLGQMLVRELDGSDHVSVLSGEVSPAEIRGVIAALDGMLGMRLHALIFSLSEGVPVIPITYDPKVPLMLENALGICGFDLPPVVGAIERIGMRLSAMFSSQTDDMIVLSDAGRDAVVSRAQDNIWALDMSDKR
jgi:polysaccharide pyruvyl transferase CsaB